MKGPRVRHSTVGVAPHQFLSSTSSSTSTVGVAPLHSRPNHTNLRPRVRHSTVGVAPQKFFFSRLSPTDQPTNRPTDQTTKHPSNHPSNNQLEFDTAQSGSRSSSFFFSSSTNQSPTIEFDSSSSCFEDFKVGVAKIYNHLKICVVVH